MVVVDCLADCLGDDCAWCVCVCFGLAFDLPCGLWFGLRVWYGYLRGLVGWIYMVSFASYCGFAGCCCGVFWTCVFVGFGWMYLLFCGGGFAFVACLLEDWFVCLSFAGGVYVAM